MTQQTAENERAAILAWLTLLGNQAEDRWDNLNWFQKFFASPYGGTYFRLAHRISRGEHHKETEA